MANNKHVNQLSAIVYLDIYIYCYHHRALSLDIYSRYFQTIMDAVLTLGLMLYFELAERLLSRAMEGQEVRLM